MQRTSKPSLAPDSQRRFLFLVASVGGLFHLVPSRRIASIIASHSHGQKQKAQNEEMLIFGRHT